MSIITRLFDRLPQAQRQLARQAIAPDRSPGLMQHEIEKAVAEAMADGRLKGSERFPAKMTLRLEALDLNVNFDGEISLE